MKDRGDATPAGRRTRRSQQSAHALYLLLGIVFLATSQAAEQQSFTGYAFVSHDTTVSSRGIAVPATFVHPVASKDEMFPVVVMAHGHGSTRHEAGGFTRVAEDLARNGIASIRMDFPGCGDSKEAFTENNLSNMLADIQASRDFAVGQSHIDPDRTGLLGFSMGGRLVVLLASTDKSYKVMATWAPAAANGSDNEVDFLGGREVYDALKARAASDGFAPFTTSWGQHEQLGLQWFTDLEHSFPLEAIRTFKGPLLVLYGSRDTVVGPRIPEQLIAAATGSSEIVRHVVTGADHGLGLFTDEPNLTQEAVQVTVEFLSQHL